MTPPVLDITAFRANFVTFADVTLYPDSLLNLYWRQTIGMIEDGTCGDDVVLNDDSNSLYMELMLAHFLTIHANTISKGVGKQGGFISASTVDKVSVTRVAPPATDMFEWWLGQTPFGQQLLTMALIDTVGGFGIGGLPERNAFRKVRGTFR